MSIVYNYYMAIAEAGLDQGIRPEPIEYNPQAHKALVERFIGPIPDNSMYTLTPRQQRSLKSVFRWNGFWRGYFTRKFQTAFTIPADNFHQGLVAKVHEKTAQKGEPVDIQLPAVVFMTENPNLLVAAHELTHVKQYAESTERSSRYEDREAEAYLTAMGVYKYMYPQGGFYDFIRVSDENYTGKSDRDISNSLAESPEFQMVVGVWNKFTEATKARGLTSNMETLPSQFSAIRQEVLGTPQAVPPRAA